MTFADYYVAWSDQYSQIVERNIVGALPEGSIGSLWFDNPGLVKIAISEVRKYHASRIFFFNVLIPTHHVNGVSRCFRTLESIALG